MLLAWSTANRIPRQRDKKKLEVEIVLDVELDPLFEATVDAVEEAILNAICAGETIVGQGGHSVPGLSTFDELRKLMSRR